MGTNNPASWCTASESSPTCRSDNTRPPRQCHCNKRVWLIPQLLERLCKICHCTKREKRQCSVFWAVLCCVVWHHLIRFSTWNDNKRHLNTGFEPKYVLHNHITSLPARQILIDNSTHNPNNNTNRVILYWTLLRKIWLMKSERH